MSQILTIELPDEVYARLAAEAKLYGTTVAERAAARLANGTLLKSGVGLRSTGGVGDPAPANGAPLKPGEGLKSICGIIDSGLGDVSVRVDEYLAAAYLEEINGTNRE